MDDDSMRAGLANEADRLINIDLSPLTNDGVTNLETDSLTSTLSRLRDKLRNGRERFAA